MYRFAEQVLRDPERRAAGMILEAKGDLCYKVRGLLEEYGREEDTWRSASTPSTATTRFIMTWEPTPSLMESRAF